MALFVLVYGFIIVSGLLFVQDARKTRPLMVALAIQIPWLSTPVLVYRLAAGLHLTVGFIGTSGNLSLTSKFLLGSTWEFALGRDDNVGLGVNLVALLLVMLLKSSIKSSVRLPLSDLASLDVSDRNTASNAQTDPLLRH